MSPFTIEISEPLLLKCIEYIMAFHQLSLNDIFTLRHQNQYNLRNLTYFDASKVRTANHGSESVIYLGSKIWKIIPTHTKVEH